MRLPLLTAVAVISLGVGACRERDESDVDTTTAPFDTGMAAAARAEAARDAAQRDTAPPTPDGQVLGDFIAANQHSANFGRMASKSGNAQTVRDLGNVVARDHDDLATRAQELGQRLAIKPVRSPNGAPAPHTAEFESMTGAQFDRAYLEHAFEHHRAMQDEISGKFLPAASNPELKTFLQQAIPVYQVHQKAAQDLLAKLPKQ